MKLSRYRDFTKFFWGLNFKKENWMGYMDSNHGMIESKSIALPTWLYPNIKIKNINTIELRIKEKKRDYQVFSLIA